MIFSVALYNGLGLGLRHLDGDDMDEIFDRPGAPFSWGCLLNILCFDVVIGFYK